MNQSIAVNVKILDKEYNIGCSPEEKQLLKTSADFLDEQMRDIRKAGVIGTEKIAVLAALNITKELLQTQTDAEQSKSLQDGLSALSEQLNASIASLKK